MEQYRLDNGLELILVPHRLAPVVAIQAWLAVGSVDERLVHAGISHVCEHMLFKGTTTRGVGDIAREVESAGGEINAWTSFNHTVYHVVLASRYLETGVQVLADALQNAALSEDELRREREVIVEEIMQGRDDPVRNAAQLLFSNSFADHPYGRPVSGSVDTVRRIDRRALRGFIDRWYVANNATVVVAGEFDARATRDAIDRWFGAMPARPIRRRRHRLQPVRELRAHVATQDIRESYLTMGFHIPALDHPDVAALDVAAIALGQGESSRLATRVRRDQGLVTAAYAYAHPLKDAGMFMISAATRPGNLADATEAAAAETFRIGREAPTAGEVAKARRVIEADHIYQRETAQGIARKFGYYHANAGDAGYEASYLERVRTITPEDVQAAVATYLTPDRATVAAVIPDQGVRTDAGRARAARQLAGRVRRAGRRRVARRSRAPSAGSITREVMPNGMRVLVKRDSSVPIVAMRAVWTGGLIYETASNNGINHLLSRLITRGCDGLTAGEIADKIDDMAGALAGVSGRNSFGLRGEWLAETWEEGLALMARCIISPALSADELAREKSQLRDELTTRTDSPSYVVFRAFVETLYRAHPYRMDVAGTDATIAGMTRRRLVSYYRRQFPVSDMTLAIVGDVEPARVIAEVRRQLGAVPASERPPRKAPRETFSDRPARDREVYRYLDRNQAHLVIGFPGTTLTDPDRHALQVLTTVLGGQGGRLFVELRERRALAYRVSAVSVEGLDPGYVVVHLACMPDKLAEAVAAIRHELTEIARVPISSAELDRAKRYLVGAYEISLQRRSTVAMALAFHEAYGLGYDEHLRYASHIRKITAADVQRAAGAFLDWDRAVTATVRPLDASPEAARRIRGVKRRMPRQRKTRRKSSGKRR